MNEQLQRLAAKLGIGVEHLWGVLVSMQRIEALNSLCAAVIILCVIVAGAVIARIFHKKAVLRRSIGLGSDDYNFIAYCTLLVMAALVIPLCINLSWFFYEYYAPEYTALLQILALLN